MRLFYVLFSVVLLATCAPEANAANILGLFYFPGRSHFVMFESLMKGLAAKGHNVTVVSHFPQKKKLPNYTDISLEGIVPSFVGAFSVDVARNFKLLNLLDVIWTQSIGICKTTLEHPTIQKLLESNVKYDLVFTEIFGVDCCHGYIQKLNVPFISMTSSVALPWANSMVGNPDNPSYIPNYFLPYSERMNFKERIVNTVYYVMMQLGYYYRSELPLNKVLTQHFGEDIIPVPELSKKTSLMFVNSHFSINQARPTVPTFIEVGGIHISPPKELPQDLQRFLDESTNGVVYFSFGSIVKAETLTEDKLKAFIETFKKLPQRVLWKMNDSLVPPLPSNIKASTWLPQHEILNHPNVRVFISHGGLMGLQEAVYAGVPVLGIPLFADQKQNIERLSSLGMGLSLDYDDINEETFSAKLKSLLEDPSYNQNAKRRSQLFRDRPQSPLDTAIYWTEYVIRHGGAPHLRSAAVDMPLYQYLLLDVIAVLLIGLIVSVLITWYAISKLFSFVWNRRSRTETIKDKKRK